MVFSMLILFLRFSRFDALTVKCFLLQPMLLLLIFFSQEVVELGKRKYLKLTEDLNLQ